MIYFDHAATSIKKPSCVINAVTEAMTHLGNSGRGLYASSMDASRVIYEAREKIADFLGCPRPNHVIFTGNATEALNIALFGLLSAGDHVITTDLEHNSVLRPLYHLEQNGVELSFVKADETGNTKPEDFIPLIKENTKLIVCTHASNLTGNLVDIAAIGKIAKEHKLLFLVDASQTAGVFPIDMKALQIDLLAFTGHKSLLGPQGTGGLCLGENVSVRPFKMGGTGVQTYSQSQPSQYPVRLEAGTLNGHGLAGLSAAVTYLNMVGIDNIREHELMLMKQFYDGVKSIDGIRIYGDFEHPRAPIVALNWKDVPSTELADALWEEAEIATRAGAHCAPRMHQALGTVEQGAVRFSFGYDNITEEVDEAVKVLHKLCI